MGPFETVQHVSSGGSFPRKQPLGAPDREGREPAEAALLSRTRQTRISPKDHVFDIAAPTGRPCSHAFVYEHGSTARRLPSSRAYSARQSPFPSLSRPIFHVF